MSFDYGEILTVEEAAVVAKVSKSTLRKHIRNGHLRAMHSRARIVRIPKDWLMRWLCGDESGQEATFEKASTSSTAASAGGATSSAPSASPWRKIQEDHYAVCRECREAAAAETKPGTGAG